MGIVSVLAGAFNRTDSDETCISKGYQIMEPQQPDHHSFRTHHCHQLTISCILLLDVSEYGTTNWANAVTNAQLLAQRAKRMTVLGSVSYLMSRALRRRVQARGVAELTA